MSRTASRENEALAYVSSLVYERSRIRLDSGKQALIRARLGKRMRHYGFTELAEYCHFLQTDADEEEFTRVIDSLTTNFTHFMREPDHFDFLVRTAIPSLKLKTGLRVWSAACSSGEEPYTIGFFLSENESRIPGGNWSVAASDLSTKVLEKAIAGIYDDERVSSLPREWLRKYFQRGHGRWAGHYRVKKSISDRIKFQNLNLIESYTHPEPFHVIFCRNVMIYFDRPTQESLVTRLAHFLEPNGYLLIGHSESLNGLKLPFRCLRPSIYQKI